MYQGIHTGFLCDFCIIFYAFDMILCDKKEFIINYEDYEEKIVVFVYAY